MAYAKTTWADGDVITADKLNHLEGGVSDVSTKIPEGALTAADGLKATRDDDSGAITVGISDKGIAAAKLADGVIPAAYTLPAATSSAIGGVKKAAAVAAVASKDAKAAAATAPTKAEFDAVVAVANENKRQLNALIASLKASGATA